jgi:SAM-dependent methyltransferase
VYERVFEPLTNALAAPVLDRLGVGCGCRLLDIAAGSGGATLMAAERGAEVLAADASEGMVDRIRDRARALAAGHRVMAAVMDGAALAVPAATFDAAISIFGVILFPDPAGGMREIGRALASRGRVGLVTWTEPEKYELVARLLAAATEVRGPLPPPPSLPAQLRFRDPAAFRALFVDTGFVVDDIVRLEHRWRLPSARWLAENIDFAPGMASLMQAMGADRESVLEAFVSRLERDQGQAEIMLSAIALAGLARKA